MTTIFNKMKCESRIQLVNLGKELLDRGRTLLITGRFCDDCIKD